MCYSGVLLGGGGGKVIRWAAVGCSRSPVLFMIEGG